MGEGVGEVMMFAVVAVEVEACEGDEERERDRDGNSDLHGCPL